MATDGVRLGVNAKLYINTATYATPTWESVDLISDLQVNAAWDEGESSARISKVKTVEATMLGLDLAGKIRVDFLNDAYRRMHEAFVAADSLDVMVLNGTSTVNNSTGFRFEAKLFGWSEDQSLGTTIFKDFTMKPCAAANPAKAVTVQSGAPIFEDFGDMDAKSF